MSLFWKLFNDDPKEPNSPWRSATNVENKKEGYSLHAYQRPSEFCPIDTMRLELKFKNTSKEAWFETFKEGPPIKNAKERKTIKTITENKDRIIYIRMGMPIMSDRENLIQWTRDDIDEKQSTLFLRSVFMDEVPIKKEIVRASLFKG